MPHHTELISSFTQLLNYLDFVGHGERHGSFNQVLSQSCWQWGKRPFYACVMSRSNSPAEWPKGQVRNIFLQVKVLQSSWYSMILMLFHIMLHRFLQIRFQSFQSHRFKFCHLLFISKWGFSHWRSLADGISQLQTAVGCWQSLDEILHMLPRYWIPGIPKPKLKSCHRETWVLSLSIVCSTYVVFGL